MNRTGPPQINTWGKAGLKIFSRDETWNAVPFLRERLGGYFNGGQDF